jgi:hypothetical protein
VRGTLPPKPWRLVPAAFPVGRPHIDTSHVKAPSFDETGRIQIELPRPGLYMVHACLDTAVIIGTRLPPVRVTPRQEILVADVQTPQEFEVELDPALLDEAMRQR